MNTENDRAFAIRGRILKTLTCVELPPDLSVNVMQMISFASDNSGASLTTRWWLYISHFTCFRYTRRFSETRLTCIIRAICTYYFNLNISL